MNTTDITETPVIHCRACYTPVEVEAQAEFGYDLYTCRHPNCPMCDYTFAAPDYSDVDLEKYGAWEYDADAPFEEEEAPEQECNCYYCRTGGEVDRPDREMNAYWN